MAEETLLSTHAAVPAVRARGPLSARLLDLLGSRAPLENDLRDDLREAAVEAVARTEDIARDEDVQLSLFLLYCLHYGELSGIDDSWEWQPGVVAVRLELERAWELYLRTHVELPALPAAAKEAVAPALFALTHPSSGPSVSRYVAKRATEEQLREFLILKSIYTLKEADPHSWAIPRLHGRAKAAMIEIQMDEYGQGRPENVHSAIFAATMRSLGLDSRYGCYVNDVPALALASFNMMSMFGLNRRLRGAIVGHLAAFEMTSSIPNKLYGDGFRRLGYGEDATRYFDIHVEADAIHEQIAGRDLAGALAEDEPHLLEDIFFGAAASLTVDGWVGEHILNAWKQGESALRQYDGAGV